MQAMQKRNSELDRIIKELNGQKIKDLNGATKDTIKNTIEKLQ